MKVRSLGLQTDFIFARFSDSIADKGHYSVVQCPSNPGYHWGNYIIFEKAPVVGDLNRWKGLFNKEFPYYSEPHHYSFTWDTEQDDKGQVEEFLASGFEFDSAIVLTAEDIQKPPRPNQDISIRKITSDSEWSDVLDLQIQCADPQFVNHQYLAFKKNQINQYRMMSIAEKGNWFGAFLNGKLVGDLGIFFEGGIARYQNVGTHPDYRNQGICGSLVYQSGKIALQDYAVKTLVMEADPDYHAARIYESIGFRRSEVNYSLSWWSR